MLCEKAQHKQWPHPNARYVPPSVNYLLPDDYYGMYCTMRTRASSEDTIRMSYATISPVLPLYSHICCEKNLQWQKTFNLFFFFFPKSYNVRDAAWSPQQPASLRTSSSSSLIPGLPLNYGIAQRRAVWRTSNVGHHPGKRPPTN